MSAEVLPSMLVLDASSGASGAHGARCLAAIVSGDDPTGLARGAACEIEGAGGAARLAARLPALLDAAAIAPARLSAIACVVGPGSFTGLRATLALAQGLADGAGLQVIPVTVGEGFGLDLDPTLHVATMARRGRVFVERCGHPPIALSLDGPPDDQMRAMTRPLRIAGDGALAYAQMWRPQACEIGVAGLEPVRIAAAAWRRRQGLLPALAALPLYVDAPQASLPAATRA